MPYHIKKPRVIETSKFVYWEGGNAWTDDYSKRKTYVNKGTADAKIVNTDGKNGGFKNSVVVEE